MEQHTKEHLERWADAHLYDDERAELIEGMADFYDSNPRRAGSLGWAQIAEVVRLELNA